MPLKLGLALQHYLMASYAYYILDKNLMEDEAYDALAKLLLEHWDEFEHQHKYLLTKEDLKAGTAFAISEDKYPNIVIGATKRLIYENIKL